MKKTTIMFFVATLAVVTVMAIRAIAQTTPALTITSLGTNQFAITFTNNIGTASYDVQTTPILDDPDDFPWTWAAIGVPGQTNFTVTGLYDSGFYRAILDTNNVPLWEAADPNDPALGPLTIYIDSPANGSTLN